MKGSQLVVEPSHGLVGRVRMPGDKSISHRALLLNAMAHGPASVEGLLDSLDVRSTLRCIQQLGVEASMGSVHGRSGTLAPPEEPLDCGNSGTTARLLIGMLASQDFTARIVGDASLSGRPMRRVTDPLVRMGAHVTMAGDGLPIDVHGSGLTALHHSLTVASAQVKTALLLAGLRAQGTTVVHEPALSRDHTERMLAAMGIDLHRERCSDGSHVVTREGGQVPRPFSGRVPGDVSSAAFFVVAATIVPGSDLIIESVGMNETRRGAVDALVRMGANIQIEDRWTEGGEPVGTLRVRHADLRATSIGGREIPRLVDELPIIGVAAAFADGVTTVRDAEELRVKESDRCASTVRLCRAMGVNVVERNDGFSIEGRSGRRADRFTFESTLDHRMAMAGVIAGLHAEHACTVVGTESIASSFPTFHTLLRSAHG